MYDPRGDRFWHTQEKEEEMSMAVKQRLDNRRSPYCPSCETQMHLFDREPRLRAYRLRGDQEVKLRGYCPLCGTYITEYDSGKFVLVSGWRLRDSYYSKDPMVTREYGQPLVDENLTEDHFKIRNTKKEKTMNKKLYEFPLDGKKVYGHHLTTDSTGQWVMEIKGGGGVHAVKKEAVKEVIPPICRITTGRASTTYLNDAGLKKGDVVWSQGGYMGSVTAAGPGTPLPSDVKVENLEQWTGVILPPGSVFVEKGKRRTGAEPDDVVED